MEFMKIVLCTILIIGMVIAAVYGVMFIGWTQVLEYFRS